ncbi:hypothetical protein WICPIJ_003179, partial [Wickerhamomyces pijperi]
PAHHKVPDQTAEFQTQLGEQKTVEKKRPVAADGRGAVPVARDRRRGVQRAGRAQVHAPGDQEKRGRGP